MIDIKDLARFMLKSMAYTKKYAIITFMDDGGDNLRQYVEQILIDDDIKYKIIVKYDHDTLEYRVEIKIIDEIDIITAKMRYV